MAAAGRKQDYDYLIKLLLIGDSGACLYCDAQLRPECGKLIESNRVLLRIAQSS